jgi:hypothetical protein
VSVCNPQRARMIASWTMAGEQKGTCPRDNDMAKTTAPDGAARANARAEEARTRQERFPGITRNCVVGFAL